MKSYSVRVVVVIAALALVPMQTFGQGAPDASARSAALKAVFSKGACQTELAAAVDRLQRNQEPDNQDSLTICAANAALTAAAEPGARQAVEMSRMKQVTAPSDAGGSTTVAERAALPRLLAIAIEHGAIDKAINGTTLTLTGSPYALAAAVAEGGDSPQTYQDYRVLNHIAVSASFDIGQNTDPLDSVNTDQLTDVSFRVLLTHDRSGRSATFTKQYLDAVIPALTEQAEVISGTATDILSAAPATGLPDAETLSFTEIEALKDLSQAPDTTRAKLLDVLDRRIVQPIISGQIPLTAAERTAILSAPLKFDAVADKVAKSEASLGTLVRTMGEHPEFTASFFAHRSGGKLEYSGGRGAYDQWIGKVELTANGALTIYDVPDPAKNQKKFRDVTAAFTMAAFHGDISPTSNPPTVFSFSARYQYLPEARGTSKPNKALAQVKVELPLSKGVTVPLSLTFASSPELIAGKEKTIRGQIGFTVDLDKLSAVK